MRHVYLGDESMGAAPSEMDRRLAIFRRMKSACLKRLVGVIVERGYSISQANAAADLSRRQANAAANGVIRKLNIRSLETQQKLHLKALDFEIQDRLAQFPAKTPQKPLPSPEAYRVVGSQKEQTFPTAALIHGGVWRRNAEISARRRQEAAAFRAKRNQWDANAAQNTILDSLGEFDEGLGFDLKKGLKKVGGAVKSAAKKTAAVASSPGRALRAVATAGLSETAIGKKVIEKATTVAKKAGLDKLDPSKWAKENAEKVVKKVKELLMELVFGSVKEQMAMLESYEKQVLKSQGLGEEYAELGALIDAGKLKKMLADFFKKKDKQVQLQVMKSALKSLPAAFPNPMGAIMVILGELSNLVMALGAEAGKFVAMEIAKDKIKNKKLLGVVKGVSEKGVKGFLEEKKAAAVSKVTGKISSTQTKIANKVMAAPGKALSTVAKAPGKAMTAGKAAIASKAKAAASPKPAPVAKPAAPAPALKKETVIQTVPKTVVAVQKDEAKLVGPSGGTLPQAATASYEVADATFAPQPGKVEVKK